jgi:hypothetical protein
MAKDLVKLSNGHLIRRSVLRYLKKRYGANPVNVKPVEKTSDPKQGGVIGVGIDPDHVAHVASVQVAHNRLPDRRNIVARPTSIILYQLKSKRHGRHGRHEYRFYRGLRACRFHVASA